MQAEAGIPHGMHVTFRTAQVRHAKRLFPTLHHDVA
jgi:hypothetical protein